MSYNYASKGTVYVYIWSSTKNSAGQQLLRQSLIPNYTIKNIHQPHTIAITPFQLPKTSVLLRVSRSHTREIFLNIYLRVINITVVRRRSNTTNCVLSMMSFEFI